jgi:SHS2 domain-containing protein
MKNKTNAQKFKFLEHTADIKFQAFGNSIEKVFENSALAMFNSMHDGKVKARKIFKINVKGKDFESLMYNFLEELLFLFDSENFFISKIKNLKIAKDFKLSAEVFGDDAKDYEIHIDIKAITYNDMFVKKQGNKWISQVVLDV